MKIFLLAFTVLALAFAKEEDKVAQKKEKLARQLQRRSHGSKSSRSGRPFRFENPTGNRLGYVYDSGAIATGFSFPLGKCRGDCDTHNDCAGLLVCLERSSANSRDAVPGCTGSAFNRNVDYCVDPDDLVNNVHYYVHNEDCAFDVRLLGNCVGDCDSDLDCDGALLCYQRESANSNVVLPGCSGTPFNRDIDYCWDPSRLSPNVLYYIGNNRRPRERYPLGKCKGDCDDSSDCAAGLICMKRERQNRNDPIPGCTGPAVSDVDYCISPADIPANMVVTEEGTPQVTFLNRCRGDCDSDLDCIGATTFCMQRSRNRNSDNPVFGCPNGTPLNDFDYCVDLADVPLTRLLFREIENRQFNQLQRCSGDCDLDSDCDGALRCFQRSGNSPSTVPGCVGRPDRDVDYCIV